MLALSGAPRTPVLDPADVARVIGWLATPESAPLTGANLRMDP
jgi:NAD(P)-dependent dehydrogenase (short-subunit alcohol dehydrogenase family)